MSGAVDQGVLRADRGRLPAGDRHRRRGRRRSIPTASHELLDALRDAPRRDGRRCSAQRDAIADDRAAARAVPPLLGGRRQRPEPHRRGRGADQAVGALLQVDRLRRHRGQEAHRPLVRAADPRVRGGPQGSNADDVAKEIAIYRAHKAAPIVIATEGERPVRRRARDHHGARGRTRRSAFVLSAMAGHLFGYEAALAIDASARPLREARAAIQAAVVAAPRPATTCSRGSSPTIERPAATLLRRAARRRTTTATSRRAPRCGSRRCCGTRPGIVPLDVYQVEHGEVGTPSRVVEDLTAALTAGIEELTRPGRRDQAPGQDGHGRHLALRRELLQVPLVARGARGRRRARRAQLPRAAHAGRRSTRRSSRWSGSPATASRATSTPTTATIHVVDRGGISVDLRVAHRRRPPPASAPSTGSRRSARSPSPAAAATGARSSSCPRSRTTRPSGSRCCTRASRRTSPPTSPARVLQGYRGRYGALRDAVTETAPDLRRRPCSPTVDVVDLLTEPVYVLADRWR